MTKKLPLEKYKVSSLESILLGKCLEILGGERDNTQKDEPHQSGFVDSFHNDVRRGTLILRHLVPLCHLDKGAVMKILLNIGL